MTNAQSTAANYIADHPHGVTEFGLVDGFERFSMRVLRNLLNAGHIKRGRDTSGRVGLVSSDYEAAG